MKQQEKESQSTGLPSVAPLRVEPSQNGWASMQEAPSPLSKVQPLAPTEQQGILGIDIENGPRWYGPGDYTYPILFCVARKWVGSDESECESILIDWRLTDRTLRRRLLPLFEDIDKADAFLGHNFRHDWGGLVGLARDVGLPLPEKKRVVDTMRDIPKHQGASKSLEDLCRQFELGDKPHLSARDWINALHRWNPDALARVRERNEMDVILTERLYWKEMELGWL